MYKGNKNPLKLLLFDHSVTSSRLTYKKTSNESVKGEEDGLERHQENDQNREREEDVTERKTYCRHLDTPTGVMLKEHMGSPAIVSAPSCITTASGLNCARTSCITLQKTRRQVNDGTEHSSVRFYPLPVISSTNRA
ncbi:hypothetical protein INR49_002466 [Caranx melampygus]|nr:hypothetical protein INR49_002466 [Caranx melampygus]